MSVFDEFNYNKESKSLLNNEDLDRMTYLLGKSQYNKLFNEEETELRTIIEKEQKCPLRYIDMIRLGMLIVGTYKIKDIINKELNKCETMEIVLKEIPYMKIGDSISFTKGNNHFKLIRDE